MNQPQIEETAPHDDHERRGPPPVGTLAVIGVLLLSISTLWILALGILEGRA